MLGPAKRLQLHLRISDSFKGRGKTIVWAWAGGDMSSARVNFLAVKYTDVLDA